MDEGKRSQRAARDATGSGPHDLGRRELFGYAAAFGTSFLAAAAPGGGSGEGNAEEEDATAAGKAYPMNKSINLWALPYPKKMSLRRCFEVCAHAGFDAVEVNYALEGDLSPKASADDLVKIGRTARELGVDISSVCSFLFWPYALTHPDEKRRRKGLDLAKKMIEAASLLGTENLLVVPGAVYIPWLDEAPVVRPEAAYERARAALEELLPIAEDAGVYLNLENINTTGFLMTPQEMVRFVDSFDSEHLRIHFDTGNVMQYQFPEHWIPILGDRIQNVHVKEASKKVNEFNLNTFRPLLDGSTNWPKVLEALHQTGYRGYLTFEYFNPFPTSPEALVDYTSDALDRMVGRKENRG